MDRHPTASIEALIGYTFTDAALLEEALRHSSYVNEAPNTSLRDNERLEFIGDAVLNLAVGHLLLQRFGGLKEGDLSRMRANLVNEGQLAQLARHLELNRGIRLGKGEALTGGLDKDSILAGTLEALVAAVYLDGGFASAFALVEREFQPLIGRIDPRFSHGDYKSQLQELVQSGPGTMPAYSIAREEGPDHDKTFWVRLKVMDIEVEGMGKSRKTAEQDAARKALQAITSR
ncbi:MAG: ribonuclease III [Desulfobacterales bacterium]|jgi:ribonuclease III|nr:ribonuclease III [Desulfobacterales bacterium]